MFCVLCLRGGWMLYWRNIENKLFTWYSDINHDYLSNCGAMHSVQLSVRSVITWWRDPMATFYALLALCEGNSGEFPSQRPVTRSFGVFFDLGLNKQLSKQSWGWWFETTSRSLWRLWNSSKTYSGRIYPCSSGFLHWHCGYHTIVPEPVKLSRSIWVNKSHESTENWPYNPHKAKHNMMTSSNGNNFHVTGPLCGEFAGHRWRGALMFPLICAWTNGWAYNRAAGDLRRHRSHYDVIFMTQL